MRKSAAIIILIVVLALNACGIMFIPAITFGLLLPQIFIILALFFAHGRKAIFKGVFFVVLIVASASIYYPIMLNSSNPPAVFDMMYHPVINANYCYKNTSGGVEITRYVSNKSDVTVPETIAGKKVVKISKGIFNGKDIKKLTLPFIGASFDESGQTHLGFLFGMNSFMSNSLLPQNLTEVIVTNSQTVPANAFRNCINIETIVFKNEIKSVGENAFTGSKWLDNHADALVYFDKVLIGLKGALESGSVIDDIKPDTIAIADKAFANISTKFSIVLPDSVVALGGSAFFNSGITDIAFGNGITEIPQSAFASCQNLISVAIPDTITTIGANAFMNCRNLTSVSLGQNVKKIEAYAFSNCVKLGGILLNKDLEYIGTMAFNECVAINDIAIPSSVSFVGEKAFSDTRLKYISVNGTIPSTWDASWHDRCLAQIIEEGN